MSQNTLEYHTLLFFRGEFNFFQGFVSFFVFSGPGAFKRGRGRVQMDLGCFFASNLHMEIGKSIGQTIRSEHFGFLQFWEFFRQPFGENTFSKKKKHPKRTTKKLKKR